MRLTYVVPPENEGRELRGILRREMRLSASLMRRLKADCAITVNNVCRFTNYKVAAGDTVCADIIEPPADFPAERGELDIIYEDDYLIALNKPVGILTHPSHSRYTGTLASFVLYHLLSNGESSCHAVNRLDRDTSGIILFAKSGYVKTLMEGALEQKEYLAAVCGVPSPPAGSIELPIRRATQQDMLRITAPDGAAARTDYETVATAEGISLLRLRLYTGRTHQIRVHCLACGWPVLGDRLYCTDQSQSLSKSLGIETQLLHSHRLIFHHPIDGRRVELSSLPQWQETLFPKS